MEKAVIILSGGPDSVAVAYWAKEQGYDVSAITFNYGQKAQIEIERAREIAEELGIAHQVVDLSNLSQIYQGVTSLVDKGIDITSEFTDPIIVPFRNGVFMAVTVAYADGVDANHIYYGAHSSDEEFYPDCRKEFYEAFQVAARANMEGRSPSAWRPRCLPLWRILASTSRRTAARRTRCLPLSGGWGELL